MKSEFEIWKWIPGYEGYYKVSNCLGAKSVTRRVLTKNGQYRTYKGHYLPLHRDKLGYRRVDIWVGNKGKSFLFHRLVADAFIPNPLNKPHVNHINEIPGDDRPSNLEWCTAKENCNHGEHNRRLAKALTNGKMSKPVIQYSLDMNFIKEWPSLAEIERELGYSTANICRCCNGSTRYSHSHGYIWRYRT